MDARKIQHFWDFEKLGNVKLFHVKDLQNQCTIDHRPMFERILCERISSNKIHSLVVSAIKAKLIYLSFC